MGPPDRRTRLRRRMWVAVAVVVAALCLAVFVLPRPEAPGPGVSEGETYDPPKTYNPTPADAGVREKLKSQIAGLDLDGVELSKAIIEISEISGVKMRVNWGALAKEGVKPRDVVNVRLQDVTLDKAIRVVVSDFSRISPDGATRSDLGHVVEDGAITISSEAELASHTYAWEYDISDLIDLFEKSEIQHVKESDSGLEAELSDGPEMDKVFGALEEGTLGRQFVHDVDADWMKKDDSDPTITGLFDPNDPENRPMTRPEIAAKIGGLVSDCIDSGSWRTSGGEFGDIRQDGGKLIVTQSNPNHQAIADLLDKLRVGLKTRSVKTRPAKRDGGDNRHERLLAARIPGRLFDAMKLKDVIEYVRVSSGANIHVKWRMLERDHIKPGTLITVHLKDSTLAEALDYVCQEASSCDEPGVGPVGASYRVNDGVVTVSSISDLQHETSLGVYDIGEVVSLVLEYEGLEQNRAEIVGRIKTLIWDVFAPDCWCQYHKGLEAVVDIGRLLVVTQTTAHHKSLTVLLDDLTAGLSDGDPAAYRMVKVSDVHSPDTQSFLRVYDLRDLIDCIHQTACEPCPRHGLRRQAPGEVRRDASTQLDTLITGIVGRDSWRDSGGSPGQASTIGGLLAVKQTLANHDAIESLLGDLRRHCKTANLDARSYIKTPRDRTAGGQLGVKIRRVDLHGLKLQEAVSALCDAPGIDLSVDRASFAKGADAVHAKVDVCLKDVTFKEAIDCIFDIVNSDPEPCAGYRISDGVIKLTAGGDSPVSVRIYDLRNLIDAASASQGSSGCRVMIRFELEGLINDAVRLDSWGENDSDARVISRAGELLVIRQRTDSHEVITELFEWLDKYLKADRVEPYMPHATQTERLIRRKLRGKMAKLELDNVELIKAIQIVLDAAGLTKYIRYQPVITEIASRKVSLRLKNVTFRQALDAVFAAAKNDTGLSAKYFIRHGVMVIDDYLPYFPPNATRVYDVRDLIERRRKAPKTKPQGRREKTVARETVEAIEKALAPEKSRPGESHLLCANTFLGMMIVTETEKNHAALAAVLEKMRAE